MLRWLVGACRPMAGDMNVSGVGRGSETQKLVQSKQHLVDVQESTPEVRKEVTLNVLDTVASLHRNDLLSPEDRKFIVSLHAATAGGGQPTPEQIGKLGGIIEKMRSQLTGPQEVSQPQRIDDPQVQALVQDFREQLEAIKTAPDYQTAKTLTRELHRDFAQLRDGSKDKDGTVHKGNVVLYDQVHELLKDDLTAARGHIRAIHQASAMELNEGKERHQTELEMVEVTLKHAPLSDEQRTAWEHKRDRLVAAIAEDDEQLAELDKHQQGPLDNRTAEEVSNDNARIKGQAKANVRGQQDIKNMQAVIDKARAGVGQDASQQGVANQGLGAAAARAIGGSGQSPPSSQPTPAPGGGGATHWQSLLNALSQRMVSSDANRARASDADLEQLNDEQTRDRSQVANLGQEEHLQKQLVQEEKLEKRLVLEEQQDQAADDLAELRKKLDNLKPEELMDQVADVARGKQPQ